jgi:predicted transglutaminase-like cysteine proteinase
MFFLRCNKFRRRHGAMRSFVITCFIVGCGIFIAPPSLAKLPQDSALFNIIEITLSVRAIALQSTTSFRKWHAALTRTQAATGKIGRHGNNKWLELTARISSLPVRERLRAVNEAFIRIDYRNDKETWGQIDYWTSPQELLSREQGDCEDYALAKYFTLRALGYAADQLLILTYRDTKINAGHTVLMVREGNKWHVLDNRHRMMMPLAYYAFNKPIYILNESNAWWLTRAA